MSISSTDQAAGRPRHSLRRSRRPERPIQKVRRNIVAALARGGIGAVGSIPYSIAGPLGAFFGGLGYFLNRRESGRAVTHLAVAFPAKSRRWHRRTARRMFAHIGRTAAEYVCVVNWPPESCFKRLCLNWKEFADNLETDSAAGRGVVTVTGHFGSWEMLGLLGTRVRPLTVVARRLNDPRLDALGCELRARAKVSVVYQDESPRRLLRALRDNRLVGILADQDLRRLPGIFVPFFGKDAYTTTAPVEIARAAKATMRVYLFARDADGYRAIMSDPIPVPDKSKGDQGVREATIAWTQFLEAQIRQRPWQWMWMHRRWRTRPPSEDDAVEKRTGGQ